LRQRRYEDGRKCDVSEAFYCSHLFSSDVVGAIYTTAKTF
jgi:hypothetical protein